jgi:hypothetical protein
VGSFLVWVPALLAYLLFLGWYRNWRAPLSPAEVDAILAALTARGEEALARNDPAILRQFLLEDDGRAFFMLNLVRLSPGEVAGPDGVVRPARAVMERYTRVFLPALLARGGHPAFVGRKAGGYFDAWGVEADPGWSIVGVMRYRSRRDLAALVQDPRFSGAHDFKFAAMPSTFSFPMRPQIMALAGPEVWVGLSLALLAAAGQIGWLLAATI